MCDLDELPTDILSRPCATEPCLEYVWVAGPFSDCESGNCGLVEGVGTEGLESSRFKYRNVTCLDNLGRRAPAGACGVGSRPEFRLRKQMPSEQGVCASGTLSDCFGNGACVDGRCVCDEGMSGVLCQVSDRVAADCPGAVTDANNICCPSGLLDANGRCCADGHSVDTNGQCCPAESIDACGQCGGSARAVDLFGRCCPRGVVDAQGVCCTDRSVDECGVCGGDGSTCGVESSVQVSVDAGLPADVAERLFQRELMRALAEFRISSEHVTVKRFSRSGRRHLSQAGPAVMYEALSVVRSSSKLDEIGLPPPVLSVDAFRRTLDSAMSNQGGRPQPGTDEADAAGRVSLVWLSSVRRQGICGNGLCEVGEEPLLSDGTASGTFCPQDCLEHLTCPGTKADDNSHLLPPTADNKFNDEAEVTLLAASNSWRASTCSGRGLCTAATGACDCYRGYTGTDCTACAEGYAPQGHSCVRLSALETLGTAIAVRGQSADAPNMVVLSTVLIVVCLVLAIVGVAIAYLVGVKRKRHAGTRTEMTQATSSSIRRHFASARGADVLSTPKTGTPPRLGASMSEFPAGKFNTPVVSYDGLSGMEGPIGSGGADAVPSSPGSIPSRSLWAMLKLQEAGNTYGSRTQLVGGPMPAKAMPDPADQAEGSRYYASPVKSRRADPAHASSPGGARGAPPGVLAKLTPKHVMGYFKRRSAPASEEAAVEDEAREPSRAELAGGALEDGLGPLPPPVSAASPAKRRSSSRSGADDEERPRSGFFQLMRNSVSKPASSETHAGLGCISLDISIPTPGDDAFCIPMPPAAGVDVGDAGMSYKAYSPGSSPPLHHLDSGHHNYHGTPLQRGHSGDSHSPNTSPFNVRNVVASTLSPANHEPASSPPAPAAPAHLPEPAQGGGASEPSASGSQWPSMPGWLLGKR